MKTQSILPWIWIKHAEDYKQKLNGLHMYTTKNMSKNDIFYWKQFQYNIFFRSFVQIYVLGPGKDATFGAKRKCALIL